MSVEVSPFGIAATTDVAEVVRRAINVMMARNAAGAVGTVAGGVGSLSDFALSAPGSGLSVNVAAGECVVPGSAAFASTPSGYYLRNTASLNLPISTANPSNPRIDMVCATINDATYHGSTNNGVIQVVTGTASSGANLSNLTGAPALPDASALIGYVLVPAAASNITSGDLGYAASRINPSTALPYASGSLGINVNMSANTPTKIFDTASLGLGTWLVTMSTVIEMVSSSLGAIYIQAAVDSATASISGVSASEVDAVAANTEVSMAISFIAVVTTAGTLKLTGEVSDASGGTALAASATYSATAVTGYTAVKIA